MPSSSRLSPKNGKIALSKLLWTASDLKLVDQSGLSVVILEPDLKESGTCSDGKTFYLDVVEKAVLGGLRAEMCAPKTIAE
jgi:hypothetical protein